MKPFLKQVAEKIIADSNIVFSESAVIFPNRRSIIFFKKYLAGLINRPVFLPKLLTIEEFLNENTPLIPADQLTLISKLYNVYVKHKKSNESFDQFYYWGEMLLSDFDDIDKNMVQTKYLFKNLSVQKDYQILYDFLTEEQVQIIKQFWENFVPEKSSKEQKNFISIWNVLEDIYQDFKLQLFEDNLAYQGMIFRNVADQAGEKTLTIDYKKLFFVGHHVLNEAEKVIFSYFRNNKIGEFFWDTDQYYMQSDIRQAGVFMKENIEKFGNYLSNDDKNFSQSKNIHTYSVSSNTAQAKILPELIKNMQIAQDVQDNDLAIVLPDEDLLFPVLNSLENNVGEFNITMGYPLKKSNAYNLIQLLMELQASKKDQNYYYKHIIPVLEHDLIAAGFRNDASELKNYIIAHNKIYVRSQRLQQNELFRHIFSDTHKSHELITYLVEICILLLSQLHANEDKDKHLIDLECITHIFKSLNNLQDITSHITSQITFKTLVQIIKRTLGSIIVPFTGEPLTGIQIMGILETRTLDFRNLIILSVNEGKFPKTSYKSSFVPHSLRKGFSMSTIQHQDAMHSYYFYRLLQRAQNIHLIYCDKTNGLITGEPSRFIHQLNFDSPHKIQAHQFSTEFHLETTKPIEIQKDKKILEILSNYLKHEKFLSPSALNTYLNCSLQFYFRYVVGIKEIEDVSESLDMAEFGNVFHKSLQLIYEKYLNQPVSQNYITELTKKQSLVDQIISDAFKDQIFRENEADIEGHNRILFGIVKKYILQILDYDSKRPPFSILSLENTYMIDVPVEFGGNKMTAKIAGQIDRLDEDENYIRVIDYKTGIAEEKSESIESLFTTNTSKRNKAIFQVLLYSEFIYQNFEQQKAIRPELYFIRNSFKPGFNGDIYLKNGSKYETIENYFPMRDAYFLYLKNLLNDIFSADSRFTQTSDLKTCSYCPYKGICNR